MSGARGIELSAFCVSVTAGAGQVCLWLVGELDLAGVEELEPFVDLAARAQLPCTFDCQGLTFIDASGIGVLIQSRRRGCAIRHLPPFARRLLDLLDLTDQVLDPLPLVA